MNKHNNWRIAPSPPLTWKRFLELAQKTKSVSLTRALEYEFFANQNIAGDIIDIGGGEISTYIPFLKPNTYHSVNIDPSARATWVVKVGETIPCEENAYDHAMIINTVEHVFDVTFLFDQAFKALKPGGKVWIAAPFLYPIHGSPDDFFRPTPSWLIKALSKTGFSAIEIFPLSCGPFSTGLTASGTIGPLKHFRKQLALLGDFLYYKAQTVRGATDTHQDTLLNLSLGFFALAEK